MIFLKGFMSEKMGSNIHWERGCNTYARIDDIEYPFLSIIILDEPVEFDNIDNLDVDIIVSIIVPEKNYKSFRITSTFEQQA